MIVNIFYIIIALLGLSFLIFMHELGHYWMARRVGMRVETFAIGFGRPIYSWMRKGVRWQIGWLLFGGYVKVAGQEVENGKDPYEIADGFFAKPPLDRIKVAFMGPFVNLVLAFIFFGIIWLAGGREKNFSEFTHKIGWVDPKSELYIQGVRPGDEIVSYDGKSFQGSNDHLYAPMLGGDHIEVNGNKIEYATGEKIPFTYKIKTYQHPNVMQKGIKTAGIFTGASYLIYNKLPGDIENPLPEGSPLRDSGLAYGDRIVWVDGELIFSQIQLNNILNDNKALLTIKRGNETLLRRVPRVHIQELKLEPIFRDELMDWQFEAKLNGTKIQKLFIIPYNLNNEAVVENDLKFIDKEHQDEAFPQVPFSETGKPLQAGDKIIAVDGFPVQHSFELLAKLQNHYVNVIVERNPEELTRVSWKASDDDFNKEVEWSDLQKIASTIGTPRLLPHAGDLYLLKPIIPKPRSEFILSDEKQAWLSTELREQKKEIEAIEDPEQRAHALSMLQSREKQLLLGIPSVQDRKVVYNPQPMEMFQSVFQQIWRMLMALTTGNLSPKWVSGPVGIVQIVHDNSMQGIWEAIFWLGAISLNLGVLNLLPIPVLDGGTILICFIELISGKKMHPKTLEKLTLPFALLLIGFFIFLTYNDLVRLFSGFMR